MDTRCSLSVARSSRICAALICCVQSRSNVNQDQQRETLSMASERRHSCLSSRFTAKTNTLRLRLVALLHGRIQ